MRSKILKPLFSLLLPLLAVSLTVCVASTPCSAAKPLPIAEGEYRLGDSPQTPEDGLVWLTVYTDGPDWKSFLSVHGHPARAFANVWRRFRLPKTMVMDPTLYVKVWPSFEAYVDEKMVYQAGVLYPDIRNRFASHTWHLIPLPPNFAGKYIYFRTFSEHPEAFSEGAWISVASRSDHLIDMVHREFAQAGAKGLHEITPRLSEESHLTGITNGFEYSAPPTDRAFDAVIGEKATARTALSADFADPSEMLLGFVGRAVEQKTGLLVEQWDGMSVLEHILDNPGINVAIVATGLPEYEAFIRRVATRSNCSATLAFDREKANQISLGSDVFLMPSLFEPRGITQMESMSRATPPLVRWTGGLVDTVGPYSEKDGTGFGFGGDSRNAILRNLVTAVREAKNLFDEHSREFSKVQRNGFKQRFLWSEAAARYIPKVYAPLFP